MASSPDRVIPVAVRPRDAARILGVSPRWLWSHTTPRGSIPCVRPDGAAGRIVLYRVRDLDDWLARHATRGGDR